jgi:hypothetical protein
MSELYYSDTPQTVKNLLKQVKKTNYPDATKSDLNSILYKNNTPTYQMNGKNLMKIVIEGISAPLWEFVNLSDVLRERAALCDEALDEEDEYLDCEEALDFMEINCLHR